MAVKTAAQKTAAANRAAQRIEDYALIGDCHTAALIGRNGSVDWLCMPRFDSASTFGALLGTEDHGRWVLRPTGEVRSVTRRYIEHTFVLVTTWVTDTGEVEVTEFMPYGNHRADLIRRVRGISGTVELHVELRIRFGYGEVIPWVRQLPEHGEHALVAVAGPDAVVARGVQLSASDHFHEATFSVAEDDTRDLSLIWYPALRDAPPGPNVDELLDQTVRWWTDWSSRCEAPEAYSAEVRRSLLVLRALTHDETGGIVAAATTSLPEDFGGERNWDYRYVWLRDASLTLYALITHGFSDAAETWRTWLLRAIAGDPADVQIMYGISGERRLEERELDWLPGYENSRPVRIGNGAFTQYQGDIFGEVMLSLEKARQLGAEEDKYSWPLQRALLGFIEENWDRPDNGIWEIRGPVKHFTHSRAMIWAAFDCGVRAVRDHGLPGAAARWESLRDRIGAEIEANGFDAGRNSYVQHYGSTEVDASLLQLVHCGYIAADDPRMLTTVSAIEHDLLRDGLLLRYRTQTGVDGLGGDEHPFLACSFWLVEQYARSDRLDEAIALMDRLVGFCNDVGLLSEEYDAANGRQAGNVPQAFSHLALVRAADAIARAQG